MNRPFRGTLMCMEEFRGWIEHKIDQEFDGENRPDYIKALQDCIDWLQMSVEIDPVKAACGGTCGNCSHAEIYGMRIVCDRAPGATFTTDSFCSEWKRRYWNHG